MSDYRYRPTADLGEALRTGVAVMDAVNILNDFIRARDARISELLDARDVRISELESIVSAATVWRQAAAVGDPEAFPAWAQFEGALDAHIAREKS